MRVAANAEKAREFVLSGPEVVTGSLQETRNMKDGSEGSTLGETYSSAGEVCCRDLIPHVNRLRQF